MPVTPISFANRSTALSASEVSVQLEAMADDVFGAAAAQGRAGARVVRRPFGEVVWNPIYPDLFFLDGVVELVAPDWRVADLERAIHETAPEIRSFRAHVRDPKTIATLGASLTQSGYHHEVRVGMVQVFTPHPDPSPQARREIRQIAGSHPTLPREQGRESSQWQAFEESILADTSEQGWTRPMRDQLTALYRWRAENTPTRFYVAFDGERPVGHVALFQHGPTAYLHGLFTDPAARRRGVGSALTQAMHREMQAIGCDRLTLQCTDDGYLPAYYHRLGFRRVGEQHIWSKAR
jgi:ribosomal protein S18 acetylase RimI-like enzyme